MLNEKKILYFVYFRSLKYVVTMAMFSETHYLTEVEETDKCCQFMLKPGSDVHSAFKMSSFKPEMLA